jgi:hypothetical protein
MSGSVWERFGERVGYGLAVVVLGPAAALQKRERRAMRTAMVEWCKDLQPVKLEPRPGVLRRSAVLPETGGSRSAEIELDIEERRVRVGVSLDRRLPSYVEVRVGKRAPSLDPTMKWRMGTPRAVAEDFRLDSESLDVEASTALVSAIAAGPLARLVAIEIVLTPERIELLTIAPSTPEGWVPIGEGIVALTSWLTARWPSSYRR